MTSEVKTLWAWVCDEDAGIMGAEIPGLGMTPLVSARRDVIDKLALYAIAAACTMDKRAALVRFERAEVIQVVGKEDA